MSQVIKIEPVKIETVFKDYTSFRASIEPELAARRPPDIEFTGAGGSTPYARQRERREEGMTELERTAEQELRREASRSGHRELRNNGRERTQRNTKTR